MTPNVNGCNSASFGGHGVLEGDRVSPLKNYGQPLEQECCCCHGVLCDGDDTSADLLCQLYGHVMPHTQQKMWVLASLAYLSILF